MVSLTVYDVEDTRGWVADCRTTIAVSAVRKITAELDDGSRVQVTADQVRVKTAGAKKWTDLSDLFADVGPHDSEATR